MLLLGKQARTASILKNVQINEFLDFDNNRLKLKSSVVAEYILHNMDYNDDVELIVSKIILVLNAHNHISRYEHMLRMIVSYSNLRMLFNRKENHTVRELRKYMKLRNRWSILRKIHSFGYSMLLLKWKYTIIKRHRYI